MLLAIQMNVCLVIHMSHWNCIFESLRNHCKLARFVLVMIGRNIFCPSPFMHPHLQHIHLWFQHKADSDGAYILKVLSYHGQIDAQISSNSCQIRLKDPQEHKEKLQAPCYSNLPERKWSPGMRWDNFSSHAITLFGNDAFMQLSKLAKSGSWHCHLQWQCTRSCVTYLMQEMYQWKEDELLFTYMPHVNFQINWL